jgi:hypothetical protein
MPAQHQRPRAGLRRGTGRGGIPHPGEGGYNYPAGPYGATGFPGSTAARRGATKPQGPTGRKDPQFLGRPTLTNPEVWARDTGPAAVDVAPTRTPRPQPRYSEVEFTPGEPSGPSRFIRANGTPRQPRARQLRSTSPEHRMTPVVGALELPERKPVRNSYAQRWRAIPGTIREYSPAPNPGKTGARLMGPSQYHPGVTIYGAPDGKPVPGMDSNPGPPPSVVVSSRYVSLEGGQEGYAVNRPLVFTKGGSPNNYPAGYAGNRHLRGGRMTGQRYFGAIEDQQRIGIPSDSYGIQRKRGPRHRPVRFDLPTPHSANYYDVAPQAGTEAPDMIHRNPPPRPRSVPSRRAAQGPRRTGRR